MLPPTTKFPKAAITPPAFACSRISRVTLTLIASRNSVVKRSKEGKEANSTAFWTYMVENQDRERTRDVHRDHEVEDRRRERHDHHHDDDHDHQGRGNIAVLEQPLQQVVHGLTAPTGGEGRAERDSATTLAGDGPSSHVRVIGNALDNLRPRRTVRQRGAGSWPS